MDLTYDRKRLDEAVGRTSGSGLTPGDIVTATQGGKGAAEVRLRAHIALTTAIEPIAAMVELRDRRKTVIYLSNGYDLSPSPSSPSETGARPAELTKGPDGREVPTFAGLAGELAAVTRAANRSNATIYTFDAREVAAPAGTVRPIDSPALAAHRRATLDTLRMLSEQTGGFTVGMRDGLDEALARIDAEASDYYVIGYYAKGAEAPAVNRTLAITVRRPGVDVKHRPATSQ
jgi:VWFA-related protein